MAHRGKNNLIAGNSDRFRRLFIDACRSGGHIKYLDDRAALTSPISAFNTANVVGGNSALLIGRAGERNKRIFVGYKVFNLHRITNGINVGNRGFHSVVNHDTALDTKFKPCVLCKCGFGRNTDCHNHHIGMKRGRIL